MSMTLFIRREAMFFVRAKSLFDDKSFAAAFFVSFSQIDYTWTR